MTKFLDLIFIDEVYSFLRKIGFPLTDITKAVYEKEKVSIEFNDGKWSFSFRKDLFEEDKQRFCDTYSFDDI
jgi:hypothetical protein